MTQLEKYWEWLGEQIDFQRDKFQRYCGNKRISYDEDVFSDTICKVGEKISKHGIADDTPSGFDNYLFKAFKLNILREKQYARARLKDDTKAELINHLWENYYNTNETPATEKVKNDMRKDFALLYMADKLLQEYGEELTHIFLCKYYYNWTYKQLQEHFPRPKLRDKMLEMKHFLQENIAKEEIDEAFQIKYGEII